MRRMELCEIHDDPRFPALLRDLVTDALQSLWDFSNSYKPVLPLLQTALAKAGRREVVDLCSGAGGPWFGLAREFEREYHFPLHVRLTDKYPNRKALETASASQVSMVEFDERAVDATDVPIDLRGLRTMFSSFHHFGRVDARRVLANAVERGECVAIFEMARRGAKTMLAVCFTPLLVWFLTPRIRPFRWSRIVWTYIVPIVPFVVWFDGWMSCLRSYSQEELKELVLSVAVEGYRWEMGSQCDGLLPVTYVIGYPVSRTQI